MHMARAFGTVALLDHEHAAPQTRLAYEDVLDPGLTSRAPVEALRQLGRGHVGQGGDSVDDVRLAA